MEGVDRHPARERARRPPEITSADAERVLEVLEVVVPEERSNGSGGDGVVALSGPGG
ncbi:MAG: hypothetical protein ACLP50_06375 [Solirubrobacteraceae bacterium]